MNAIYVSEIDQYSIFFHWIFYHEDDHIITIIRNYWTPNVYLCVLFDDDYYDGDVYDDGVNDLDVNYHYL